MIDDRDPRGSGSRAVIDVSGTAVRLRIDGVTREAEPGDVRIALSALDDEFALAGERVVPSRTLWAALFESLAADDREHAQVETVTVVHPTSWSPGRLNLLSNAARVLAGTVMLKSRAEVLAERGVTTDVVGRSVMVVEVEPEQAVTVVVGQRSDGGPAAALLNVEDRSWFDQDPKQTAAAVAQSVTALIDETRPGIAVILVDAGEDAGGEQILDAIDATGVIPTVSLVDPDAVVRAASQSARTVSRQVPEPVSSEVPSWVPGALESEKAWWQGRAGIAAAGVAVLGAIGIGVAMISTPSTEPPAPAPTAPFPTSLLVEGRVQLMIPAEWVVRRIPAGGAGSARVEVISPANHEVMVHVTQSRVPAGETLNSTAETLRTAMEKEQPGVFVDFEANDRRMDRAAVTYTEVREGHDIKWTVLLDGQLRIGVGCQAPSGDDSVVSDACDLAVQTVHEVRSSS